MVDLTGGLPSSREAIPTQAPDDPDMRLGVNIWLQDDEGRFALPRIGVEALASSWDKPAVQANLAFADGRVLIGSCEGPLVGPYDDGGQPSVLGAGPITFRCVKPFERWTMSFRGPALDTTLGDQMNGRVQDGPWVDVEIDVDMTMAVPPWVQGEMSEDARRRMAAGLEASFMGGARYEQLFRATGTLRVGDDRRDFSATGLRIHRFGKRDTTEFRGHCWQSAVFPDGRAFGYIAFPDTDDGKPAYREGFVYDGERLLPATLVHAPWMTQTQGIGDDVSFVLECESGRVEVEAETNTATAIAGASDAEKLAAFNTGTPRLDLFFQQASARYTWDGQSTYGMVERSLPNSRVKVHTTD